MTKNDVLKIKERIEESKKKKIQIETKLEGEYKYVKDEYGCTTIKDINAKLDAMDKEISTMDISIKEKTKELEEAYNWDM